MEEEEKKPKKVSLFDRLKQGLTKAKQGITDRIDEVLKANKSWSNKKEKEKEQ